MQHLLYDGANPHPKTSLLFSIHKNLIRTPASITKHLIRILRLYAVCIPIGKQIYNCLLWQTLSVLHLCAKQLEYCKVQNRIYAQILIDKEQVKSFIDVLRLMPFFLLECGQWWNLRAKDLDIWDLKEGKLAAPNISTALWLVFS